MKQIITSYRAKIRRVLKQGLWIVFLRKLNLAVQNFSEALSRYWFQQVCNRKIDQLYSYHQLNINDFDDNLLKDHIAIWSKLSSRVNTKWMQVYSHISGIKSPEYVPEDIFYRTIVPSLYNISMANAYADKNMYEKFHGDLFPKTILRNIEGVFYDSDYIPIAINDDILKGTLSGFSQVIIKPSIDSWGGGGIELFNKINHEFLNKKGDVLCFSFLSQYYKKNYIIQEKICQHNWLGQFNESSTNTIRIITYRSVLDEKIVPLSVRLRVGEPGSIVDHMNKGGSTVSIHNNGMLGHYAIQKLGKKIFRIGQVDLTTDHQIPKYNEIVKLVVDVACHHLYARILAFDLTIDINGCVRIIEINYGDVGINQHQMLEGPLFKQYLNEIIEYCSASQNLHHKTFWLPAIPTR